MVKQNWTKEPWDMLIKWMTSNFTPPLIDKKHRNDENGIFHYEIIEGTNSKKQIYCQFKFARDRRDVSEELYEFTKEKERGKYIGKDARLAKNIMSEALLRFLKTKTVLGDLEIPDVQYALSANVNSYDELTKLLKSKKMIQPIDYKEFNGPHGSSYKFSFQFYSTEKIQYRSIKGETIYEIGPNPKITKQNAARKVLKLIEAEKEERLNKEKADKEAKKAVVANYEVVEYANGVRNLNNKFIEIKDNDFASLEQIYAEERTRTVTPFDTLKRIANREKFNVNIIFPSGEKKVRKESTEEQNIHSQGNISCFLKTETRPAVVVIGIGLNDESARNNAAEKALYNLHIQARSDLNWASEMI